jgi:molybdopterin converting factor small subunit
MISNDKLIRWRQVASRATPGVWTSIIKDDGSLLVNFGDQCNGFARDLYFGDLEDVDGEDIANSEFIAESRAAIPELLDEVESLRQELNAANIKNEQLKGAVKDYITASTDEIVDDTDPYENDGLLYSKYVCRYCGEDDTYGHTDTCEWQKKLNQRTVAYDNLAKLIVDNVTGL